MEKQGDNKYFKDKKDTKRVAAFAFTKKKKEKEERVYTVETKEFYSTNKEE